MKLRLPLIGQIKSGKDAQEPPLSLATVETPIIDKSYDVLGGLFSFNSGRLSNERTISTRILEANKEWVYRNNDVIAQEVGAINFELFSVDLRGGEIEYSEIDDHPLLDLLDKFNSRTTKADGIYMTQSHKKLTGDAFWLLDKNGGVIDNIFILPPDKIEVLVADPTSQAGDLISGYHYSDVIDGKKVEHSYDADEIIHFKKPNPKNPFRGYGAVEALADTIDSDSLTNEVQRQFFEKGAISNFVLTTENNLTQDQLKRLKAEMRAMYGGAKNAYTTMIFGNGLKPADIGFSNKDMEYLDLLEWYRDKIMIGFGNTKASIGIVDDVNRASHESSLAGWLRGTIKPDMASIVGTLNEFLVPLYGENLILGFEDPVPQNIADDADQAVKLKEAGIIQINEAREMVSLSPIDGGDVFAPSGGTTADPNAQDGQEPTEPQKRYVKPVKSNVPPALRHFNIEAVLRSRGIYFKRRINKQLKEDAKPLIRKMMTPKKKEEAVSVNTFSPQFTDDTINEYYEKQIHIVEAFQNQFHDKVKSLLDMVKEQTLSNFENDIKSIRGLKKFIVNKELFDQDAIKVQASIDLVPVLMQEVILAGEEAFSLIGVEDTYIPYKIEDSIRQMVDKFAESMLNTDKDKLTGIINSGIEAGDSVATIRDQILEEFGDYSKMQAERITRTEILRAASMAAEDAFIQSGVVEGKQWLLAPNACSVCAPYGGKIEKLNGDFYDSDDSGFQNGNPPLHVNCRCQLIPVVKGVNAYEPDHAKEKETMSKKIQELESQLDKRTTVAKKLLEEKTDDTVYIKTLEKHLGISDE